MDIAAVWVHVNTHAQHLNIVAITEGKLRHLRQYRVSRYRSMIATDIDINYDIGSFFWCRCKVPVQSRGELQGAKNMVK